MGGGGWWLNDLKRRDIINEQALTAFLFCYYYDEKIGNPDADHDIMKRSTWTAGLEDPNQNWDVKYNTKGKAVPQGAPQAKMGEDYEVCGFLMLLYLEYHKR